MLCPHLSRLSAVALLLVSLLAGCGREETEADVELPDWLSDGEGELGAPPSIASAGTTLHSSAPKSDQAALKLQLNPGERFPFRKVVDQELKQSSLNGQPQISRSRLELTLAITVADVRDGRTMMNVKYDRVQFSQDVAGETIQYDSAQPSQTIPAPVQAYHSMVGDGFGFWLGANNQVEEVVGFREFVDRCLSHVPADQKQQALVGLEASAGEQGIADFVDNTIGLLPYDAQQGLGDSWEKTRQVARPVPMQINTVYTLSDVNDQTAEIMVGGTITPSTTLGSNGQDDPQVRVAVQGGRCAGRCTLDRNTGLPKASQVERIVDMTVQIAGGIVFDQQKRTVTTVESFPVQTAAEPAPGRMFR